MKALRWIAGLIVVGMLVVTAFVVGAGGGFVIGVNAAPLGIPLTIINAIKNELPQCDPGSGGVLGAIENKLKPLKWLNDVERKDASIIIQTGQSLGATAHDIQTALGTAMNESGLINVTHGLGSSLGLFQQESSWGSVADRLNPVTASTNFYKALFKVKNRGHLTLLNAAIAVQHPKPTDNYAHYRSTWVWDGKVSQLTNAAQQPAPATAPTASSSATPTATPSATPTPSITTPPKDNSIVNCLGLSLLGPNGGKTTRAMSWAENQLGKPYVWGATGPNAFDCSGLTQAAYHAAGVTIPRDSRSQYAAGPRVDNADGSAADHLGRLKPGDLVFWAHDPSDPSTIHHVAIYIGTYQGRPNQIIEAPETGDVVKIIQMYFGNEYIGATRPTAKK